ncbi:flagellar hook-associated protein 3 [Treponema rectale]|uniref:Flagellar hook-associated protein 3 n=1 Tax=Treponema rectale TaxID=744512 RepID=A0A840SEA0_9SPIR|nr:flagellar hook-associated protein 3 [Treponema rectale]MBB5218508.1 flagellar hook-associated protein 3 FlgL [Treponema rectale]QOS39807.1 flagellar hook-associated protein 3 [Treponema rectale]
MNRISSQMNNNDTQYYLRKQEIRQNQMNAQIGSQSRIGSLRDDPIAAGHLVRYQSYLTRVNQFEKNAQTAADNFQVRDGYINQNLQIMQRVRELAVTGANGTYNQDDLKNMAVEVNELLKEMIQNANAVGPDGNSLFAGTRSSSTAFDIIMGNVPGADGALIEEVRYNGNIGLNKIEVDENNYMTLDASGNKTFWAEKQSLIAQRDMTSWQSASDAVISVDGVDIKINAGDNVYALAAKINDSGAAIKASVDPISNGLSLVTTDAHQIWLEDRDGSVLGDLGIIKDKSQLPPYNIADNVKVSGGSLFDSVIALRDAMLRGDNEAIGGRILGTLDEGMNNLTTRLAKSGSDYERAVNNVELAKTNNLNVTRLVSREGDVDMTKAITDLKMLEYVNQATLSNAGKMYSSTLLDYIR